MDIEKFRAFCLSLPGTTEKLPFGEDTLVFYVGSKMFALADIEIFQSVNLKCVPEKAVELREQYDAVQPGYHMNKQHWNTIEMNNTIPDKLILEWVTDSYNLVLAKLTKKEREGLGL